MEGLKEYLPKSISAFTQEILELETAVILVFDENINLIGVNSAFCTMLPFDNLEDFTQQHTDISELFIPSKHSLHFEKHFEWIDEVLRSPNKEHQVKMLDRKGEKNYYSVRIREVSAEDKNILIAQFEDVSAFVKAKRAQIYFEEFKQKFLRSMSHEFRTPMNGIIGFVDLLEHTDTTGVQTEYIDFISHSAQTMMNNVENLLELAQLESGEIQINEGPIKITEILESFSDEFIAEAKEKKIQLLFYISPALPEDIVADIDKIKKVLRNLIRNAIKYTKEKGQVYVEIRVKDASEKNKVRIEYGVADTGVGIDRDRLSTIIRPFASAKESQSHGKDGLGVGLSVCYKLTEMMDSKLKVATQVGKGSRFSFELTHESKSESPFELVKGSRMAIWAEDHYTVLYSKLLKEYLNAFGVEVIEIDGLVNKELNKCDALFIVTDYLSASRVESIKSNYNNLQIIPVINTSYKKTFKVIENEVEDILLKPLLPHKIYDTLNIIWNKVPLGLLKRMKLKPKESVDKLLDLSVLVAEDNPINLKLIETLLSQYRLKIISAVNGQQAVDIYKKDKGIDLVLMDIDMPVMDGIEATRMILDIEKVQKRKHVPIVALTAHALSGDRERLMRAGLDEHLVKPLDRAKLELVLKQYLNLEIN